MTDQNLRAGVMATMLSPAATSKQRELVDDGIEVNSRPCPTDLESHGQRETTDPAVLTAEASDLATGMRKEGRDLEMGTRRCEIADDQEGSIPPATQGYSAFSTSMKWFISSLVGVAGICKSHVSFSVGLVNLCPS